MLRNNHKKGFTLSELLIVVAIIGVLVAISIPIFTSQLHKAKVATDIANLRGFYAQLQADYIETDKEDVNITEKYGNSKEKHTEYTDLQGNTIKLKDGYFAVTWIAGKGYSIAYCCNDARHEDQPNCRLVIG